MGLGPGDAGRTDRDLSKWNHHDHRGTRLMYRNQLYLRELLKDGTEVQLASFCLADAELRHLTGADDPAFAALNLKARYSDASVLGGAPHGMPPDRGMELELETGDARMPRSRPVTRKRLSARDGELAELRAQLIDLLDRGWIHHSTAGQAAVVFARNLKPDGSWRICYDYRGLRLNAITSRAVEPLPHIDVLLDGTLGSCYFTKLDLVSSYHQLRVLASDRWKTSFRSQLGQFEWNVVPFGLQGSSLFLMRVMDQALGTVSFDYPSPGDSMDSGSRPGPTVTVGPRTVHAGVPARGIGPAWQVCSSLYGRLFGTLSLSFKLPLAVPLAVPRS
jgi:hypothetical protein